MQVERALTVAQGAASNLVDFCVQVAKAPSPSQNPPRRRIPNRAPDLHLHAAILILAPTNLPLLGLLRYSSGF